MELYASWFAVLFYILFLGVVFVWPSWRTYRQTGINPVAFGRSDSAHDFIGRCFKVLLTTVALAIALSVSSGGNPCPLWPILAAPAVQFAGMALCCAAVLWTAVAQAQMGRAWRIGIDRQNKTTLHTAGLFAWSRNPIFLGLLVALLGLFLLLPSILTLLCGVAGYLLIGVAIRLEEEYLLQQHGALYQGYKDRVRRWL